MTAVNSSVADPLSNNALTFRLTTNVKAGHDDHGNDAHDLVKVVGADNVAVADGRGVLSGLSLGHAE